MSALDAQKKTIQLLKAEADKEQGVAGRQKCLADARIDLFWAREKLITSIAKPKDLQDVRDNSRFSPDVDGTWQEGDLY